MAVDNAVKTGGYSTAGEIHHLDRLELYKTEKPYQISFPPINVEKEGARQSNFKLSAWPVSISDFSDTRDSFSTDVQGFELDTFPTSVLPSDLQNLATIEERYHPEAVAYLERKYDPRKVFIFDTTIRGATKQKSDPGTLLANRQVLGPARDCHVDQSPGSVRRRVRHNFPDEAEDLLKHRVRVINIWRPLVWPCHTHPLAMCDWRSTVPQDYTLSDLKSPVWDGEVLQVFHNPAHRWWFARQMQQDDVILIKMYDSEAAKPGSKIAMCTPHCSFDWKDAPENAQPRQSMEIRAIVFS